jgi:hypothetical protein
MRGDLKRVTAVGYKFTLVLSREVTDDESATLRESGCADAVFGPDTLPANADVPVTKMDFDDTSSPTLAVAIESALEAVKKVPDLSVPGLTVPAQPAEPPSGEPGEVIQGVVVEEDPAAKKASARKPGTRKASAKKTSAVDSADDAMDPVGAAAGSG